MESDFKVIPAGIENVSRITINGTEHLATKNLAPGISVYGEQRFGRDPEYRAWDPNRSKLAAMILKQMKIPLDINSRALYLGAASGTTASHISDIASKGVVYAVEFSYSSACALLDVCKYRANLIPIFADARKPGAYTPIVERVDMIYQDISQRDQVEIAISNASYFLREAGYLIIVLKARSIAANQKPKDIFIGEIGKLERDFKIMEIKTLEPFHLDHLAVIARYIK